MRIMVSGSRDYKDYEFIRSMLEDAAGSAREVTVIHGNARGADKLAGEAAEEYGFRVEAYPADWSLGKRGGSVRNGEMLIKNIDIVLFFFYSGSANAGTRDAAKKAIQMEVPSRYFLDDEELTIVELKKRVRPF